jgi:hypothetical protein
LTPHEYLGPSTKWMPLVARGVVTINRAANRLVWPDGTFAAALSPTAGIAERLADLPVDPESLKVILESAKDLVEARPALEALQLLSGIGAMASVANVGISLAGFAAVLQRLQRIEGKLDQMLSTLDSLKQAVASLGVKTDTFLMARLASAKENLDRSIAATSEHERLELRVMRDGCSRRGGFDTSSSGATSLHGNRWNSRFRRRWNSKDGTWRWQSGNSRQR